VPRKPAFGVVKAQGSNHRVGVPRGVPAAIADPLPTPRNAPVPHPALTPEVMLPLFRPGSRSGRSSPPVPPPIPERERLVFRSGLKLRPVCRLKIPLVHQPFSSFDAKAFEYLTFAK